MKKVLIGLVVIVVLVEARAFYMEYKRGQKQKFQTPPIVLPHQTAIPTAEA